MENNWISVEEKLPDSPGSYQCKDANGEFPAFWVRKGNGKFAWLSPNENLIPTHWKPQH